MQDKLSKYFTQVAEEQISEHALGFTRVHIWAGSRAELQLKTLCLSSAKSITPLNDHSVDIVSGRGSEGQPAPGKTRHTGRGNKKRRKPTSSALASLRNHYSLAPPSQEQADEAAQSPPLDIARELHEGDAERLSAFYAESPAPSKAHSDTILPLDQIGYTTPQQTIQPPAEVPQSQLGTQLLSTTDLLTGDLSADKRESSLEADDFGGSEPVSNPPPLAEAPAGTPAEQVQAFDANDPFSMQPAVDFVPVIFQSSRVPAAEEVAKEVVENPNSGQLEDDWEEFQEHSQSPAQELHTDQNGILGPGPSSLEYALWTFVDAGSDADAGQEDDYSFLPDLSFMLATELCGNLVKPQQQ